ncbi:MAG: DNA polymerase Y family protein [Planctomycetia bacterium]
MPRILTLWLPRWPVQRRLSSNAELRHGPVFVCQRQPQGAMTVVAWAIPRRPAAPQAGGKRAGHVRAGDAAAGPATAGDGVAIHAGMPLAEAMAAMALVHGPHACRRAWIDHDDPAADRDALLEIARWCRRFTPAVAVEGSGGDERQRPECLHLDVTATAGFFGGEERLARTAVWTLAARGLHARGAIADTPGAAWAAAHHVDRLAALAGEPATRGRRRSVVVAPGGLVDALPATGLRLDGGTLQKLCEVGIDSIGGVMRLPRKSLASRFGPLLVRRLAELTGERAEPLEPLPGGELPQASHAFDFPLSLRGTSEEQFAQCLRPLLEACMRPLSAAGRGVTALQVRLERARLERARLQRPGSAGADAATGPAGRSTATSAPVVIDVGLFRPSVAVAHLAELIRLRMSRMQLPKEIDGVSIEVVAAGEIGSRQRMLFGAAEEAGDGEVAMLLERLAGRLGRAAVYEPRPVADAQPEHAWMAVPPGQAGRSTGRITRVPSDDRGSPARGTSRSAASQSGPSPAPERRPFWMFPRPLRLEPLLRGAARESAEHRESPERRAASGVPVRFRYQSRVHRVLCAQGPERIETAWWRGPWVRRDYFLVEAVVEGVVEGSGEGKTGGDRQRDAGRDGSGNVDEILRLWIFRQVRDGDWFVHGVFA